MMDDEENKFVHLNKNVGISNQEVEVKVPRKKTLSSFFGAIIIGSILVLPYFVEINWFLKILFCVVVYSSLFLLYHTSDENKYLKNYILLEDNTHRVKIMK